MRSKDDDWVFLLKVLILFGMTTWSAKVFSANITCGSYIKSHPKMKQAVDFLKSVQGYYEADGCKVMIQVCSVDERDKGVTTDEIEGSLVGDVLIIDQKGNELYVPIDLQPLSRIKKIRYKIKNYTRAFHYDYIDKNEDSQNGRFERYLFEIVKTPDLSKIDYIEFGINTSRSKETYWATCRIAP